MDKIPVSFSNYGFHDTEDDFYIIINGCNFPINTQKEKKEFAFEMIKFIESIMQELRMSRVLINNIESMIDNHTGGLRD